MSSKTIRSNPVLMGVLALAVVLACVLGLPELTAQEPAPSPGAAAEASDAVKAKVADLAQLSKQERRAALREMTPEQRREVWFELKRSKTRPAGRDAQALKSLVGYRNLQARKNAGAPQAAAVAPPERLVGMIQYDDGSGSSTFAAGNVILGNHFDSAVGDPLLASGTISTVVGVVAQGPAFTTSSAGFVIEGPQTGGGGAMAIFSTFTGASGGPTDTVTFAGLGVNYPGSSFFVLFGNFSNSYVPVFGTGTTQSQGYHGVIGYTGGMGPNITSTFDFGDVNNALVRVRGNVLPVELMSFDVEGE